MIYIIGLKFKEIILPRKVFTFYLNFFWLNLNAIRCLTGSKMSRTQHSYITVEKRLIKSCALQSRNCLLIQDELCFEYVAIGCHDNNPQHYLGQCDLHIITRYHVTIADSLSQLYTTVMEEACIRIRSR